MCKMTKEEIGRNGHVERKNGNKKKNSGKAERADENAKELKPTHTQTIHIKH